MVPKFKEHEKVKVGKDFGGFTGFVMASLEHRGRMIYKVSKTLDPRTLSDEWIPEEELEKVNG